MPNKQSLTTIAVIIFILYECNINSANRIHFQHVSKLSLNYLLSGN